MHIYSSFVNLGAPSGLELVFAGLRRVARAAGRRGTVLPPRSGCEDPDGDPGGSPRSRPALLPEEGVSPESLYAETIDRLFDAIDGFAQERGAG